MKLLLFFAGCFASLFFFSCKERDDYQNVPESVLGYRPVYLDTSVDITTIVFSTQPRAVINAGKVYLYKQYLFIGELGKGIHVVDNTDPNNPVPQSFINIPFNYDMTIKDSLLYADTYMGLVVIDISKLPAISVKSFTRSLSNNTSGVPVLPRGNATGFGANSRIYFECMDENRGVVIGWESATIQKPKCYQ